VSNADRNAHGISPHARAGLYCKDFSALNMELPPEELVAEKWEKVYTEIAEVWQSKKTIASILWVVTFRRRQKISLLPIEKSSTNKQRPISNRLVNHMILCQLITPPSRLAHIALLLAAI
jgi:hypothetical protein